MMEIQKYIRAFNSIEDANVGLRESLGLIITKQELILPADKYEFGFPTDKIEPVWVYNYNQIKSPKAHPIVVEARALILDAEANIVSMSFPRFFNMGEGPAASIQYPDAIAEKKYDGSIVVVYNHKDKWFIQTRSMANADGRLAGFNIITYREAVILALEGKFSVEDPFCPFTDEENCYVFEFVSPYNRIVTPYTESELVLLTIVNKMNQREYDSRMVDEFAFQHGFKRPESFFLISPKSLEKIIDTCETLDEGYVINNPDCSRVKVKNPSYLAVARSIQAGGEVSPRHFAAIVLQGEHAEIAAYFPEYAPMLDMLENTLTELDFELHTLWEKHKDKADDKDFALSIALHPFRHILFQFRKGRVEAIDVGLRQIKPEHLIEYVTKTKKEQLELVFDELLEHRS